MTPIPTELRELLERVAEALESEIDARYGEGKTHPALARKYESDMADVNELRTLLATPPADAADMGGQAGEEVEVRGLQWLNTGHYRKKPPQFGYNPHDWNQLMTVAQHERILAAWQRTQSAGVPDGWRLVPVEPTPAMLRAGVHQAVGALPIYRAMLSAAPAQPAAQDQPEDLDAVALCGCRIVHSRKFGNTIVFCAQHCVKPAAQGQGEVQRLREALEGVVKRCSKEHGGSGYVGRDGQYLKVIDAALAASTGQEVEK